MSEGERPVFDSTVLIDLFNPRLETANPDLSAKLKQLCTDFDKRHTRILVPMPVLTELLVRAGDASQQYTELLSNSTSYELIPFDKRAAAECAILLSEHWSKRETRNITRTKFKYDWMIVACALSRQATAIYSTDEDIQRVAARVNLRVIDAKSLHVPPPPAQGSLPIG